jgi:hypothetical protein
LDHGGQKANFSQASPRFGEGGGRLLASKLKRGSLGTVGLNAPFLVVADMGVFGVVGRGENSNEISSGGGPAKNS